MNTYFLEPKIEPITGETGLISNSNGLMRYTILPNSEINFDQLLPGKTNSITTSSRNHPKQVHPPQTHP